MRHLAIPILAALLLRTAALAQEPPHEEAPPPPHPNVGFGNEAFFIRSDDDNFILIPTGRLQIDFLGYQGGSNQPFNTFLPKRARIELQGTLLKHWDFQLGAEFTGAAPVLTDVYLNANYSTYANVQVGQFDGPFTMENRTSDKWVDLQERSSVVRSFAIPENKFVGAMVWGQPERKWAYWSLGVFNGDGMSVFPHRFAAFDVMGRAWLAPLGLAGNQLFKNVWLGGSYWTADRSWSPKSQLDRISMKDQAGFVFFNSASGSTHLGDFGALSKWAVELNAPVWRFVVKAEVVGVREGVRAIDSAAGSPLPTGTGLLAGTGFYGRVSYFVWGDPLINGLAGTQNPPHLFGELKPGKTESALQLVAEVDRLSFSVVPTAPGAGDAVSAFAGDYGLTTLGVGANFWYTKHLRFTANVLFNLFDGAVARPLASSNTSWEVTLRAALAL